MSTGGIVKISIIIILLLSFVDAKANNRCTQKAFQEDNYCIIAGGTADTSKTVNMAHSRSMALKTARILAYEKMAEKLKGITISSFNNLADDLYEHNNLKTIVETTLKDVSFESETLEFLPDGSPWAQVTISIPKKKHLDIGKKVLKFENGVSSDSTNQKSFVIDLRGAQESLSLRFDIISNKKTIYSYNPLKSELVFINDISEIDGNVELVGPQDLNAKAIKLNAKDAENLIVEFFNGKKVYILR